MRILFAIDNGEEQKRFREAVAKQGLTHQVVVPATVGDADEAINKGGADVIVTDLHFHSGGFAEWLFLWNHPFVLIADWTEYERIGEIVQGQFSDFVIRDNEYRHIEFLPLVLHRLMQNVQSIERQNIELKMNEARYRELVQALPDIIYTLDPEGRFVFVNDSVRRLGWDPLELIGKHFSMILDPEEVERVSRQTVLPGVRGKVTGPENAPKLFDERRTGDRRTQDLEVHLKRKTDVKPANGIVGQVIAYGEVSSVGFESGNFDAPEPGSAGIIRDITGRKESQRLLKQALNEKQTLLMEVHHRIKNNLQVISSLLNLHAAEVPDETAQAKLEDAQMQIQSIAMVHEHLYRSTTPAAIDAEAYIQSLGDQLMDIYGIDPARISLDLDVQPIPIPVKQATPVALLLTELLSNSLKHAFGTTGSGRISIKMSASSREDGQELHLLVSDDGAGLPPEFDIRTSASLGHNLVLSLVEQLNGTISTVGAENPDQGTTFDISFPLEAVATDGTEVI